MRNSHCAFRCQLYTVSILIAVAIIAPATGAVAQEWGTLAGRLVVDGRVGEPAPLTVTSDTQVCGQHTLFDETVIVGENGGLTNAFIYLYVKPGKSVEVHPDYASAAEKKVVLDNRGCRFEPHVLMVLTGQELEIRNSDQGIGHNTNAQMIRNPPFNVMVSNDSPVSKTFQKSETYPASISCSVHPWMKAHMLVRDNPYMAITGKDGSFEIKNIPAGEHEFILWHESVGNLKYLSLNAAGETNRRGRAKLDIPAGETLKMGDVRIKPAALGL